MNRFSFKIKIILLAVLFLGGCVTTGKKPDGAVKRTGNSEAKEMIARVQEINETAPKTFAVTFEIDGNMKKKKFKSLGKAFFDRGAGKMYISFIDYIFKSPLTRVYIDGSEIIFYFPVDKTLIKDNARTINLKNYNNIEIPYYVVYDLLTGSIPLIKDYSVKDGLVKKETSLSYLILENKDTYQTIAFSRDYPDKIKLLNKKTKNVIEIYLKRPMKTEKGSFYRTIVMIDKKTEVRLTLNFKKMKFNRPVKVNSIKNLKVPRDAKIISR